MVPVRGTVALVLLLAVYLGGFYGWGLFREGGPPVFFQEQRSGLQVLLGEGFPNPGVHQFSDGMTPDGVIRLTIGGGAPVSARDVGFWRPLQDGESLSLRFDGAQVVEVKRNWMPALQRMALDIPLHPDRMSVEDWQALPGIGPRLAQIIEKNRQQNGDFGAFETLRRVPGIGPGRLRDWKQYFH
jgi:competence protein ComEA